MTQGPVRLARSFDCPNCGGSVQIRAGANTLEVACGHCGATIDASDDRMRIISLADEYRTVTPAIELGTRGTLKGVAWEVIGMLVRSDAQDRWSWQEYLLFNPWRGFRWLVLSEGDWTFVEPLRLPQRGPNSQVTVDGTQYRRTAKGQARIDHVRGEFYWRVQAGDVVDTADYESMGSSSLYFEGDGDEINWSRGTRVSERRMREAFPGLNVDSDSSKGGDDEEDEGLEHHGSTLMQLACLGIMVLIWLFSSHASMVGFIVSAVIFAFGYGMATAVVRVVLGATANNANDGRQSSAFKALRIGATLGMAGLCFLYVFTYGVFAAIPESYDSSSSGYSSGSTYYGK